MPANPQLLAEARARLEHLARNVSLKLEALPAGETFARLSAALLVEALGRDGAAAYLHGLAEELAEVCPEFGHTPRGIADRSEG